MKLIIIMSENNTEIIDEIRVFFTELQIDINFIKVTSSWENDDAFFNIIFGNNHFLIITDNDTYQEKWFNFVVAYCLGKKCSLYLFLTEEIHRFPVYMDFIQYSYDIAKIKKYYTSEKNLWLKKEIIEKSKEKILNSGYFFTPYDFFLSIDRNDIETFLLFLHAEMSPNNRNEKGVPALNFSIRLNHNEIAKMLLEHHCSINEISLDNGNNALMDAAGEKNLEMAEILIEKGIDLNVKSKNDQTALMLAVSRDAIDIVELLLVSGVDTEIRDVLDMTAKRYAQILGYEDIVRLFKKYSK